MSKAICFIILVVFATVIITNALQTSSSLQSYRGRTTYLPSSASLLKLSSTDLSNFKVINRGETNVLDVPTTQEGVKLYIAVHGEFQSDKPGNGGMRLMSYENDELAISDAVRLAEGMTRKHAMYQTGFSGAKLVVNHKGMILIVFHC